MFAKHATVGGKTRAKIGNNARDFISSLGEISEYTLIFISLKENGAGESLGVLGFEN